MKERLWFLNSMSLLVFFPPPGMSPRLFLQPNSNVTFPESLPYSSPSPTAPGTSLVPPIPCSALCDNWGDTLSSLRAGTVPR